MLIYDRPSKNFCCIYKITCLKNGLIYVGQTTDFGKRTRDHARSVKNYMRKQPLWTYTFAVECGAYSFENDYKVEILEYIDKNRPQDELYKLLDEREIYWIEKLHSTDPNVGFNLSKGGQFGHRNPTNIGQFKWHGFNSSFYFIFDFLTKDIEMMNGLNSIDEVYGFDYKASKSSHLSGNGIQSRYYVVSTDLKSRKERLKKHINSMENTIYTYIDTNRQQVAQIITALINKLYVFRDIEFAIRKNYAYDDNLESDEDKYIEELSKLLLHWCKMLGIYGVSLYTRNYSPIFSSYPAALYDVSTQEVSIYDSIDKLIDDNNLVRYKFIHKMSIGKLINKRYYIYFIDDELANVWRDLVKDTLLKTSQGRSDYYKYFQGYLKTRKHGNHLTFVKKRKMHK